MHRIPHRIAATALIALGTLAAGPVWSAVDRDRALPVDGLEVRDHRALDLVRVRPGVDLSSYSRVLVDPVDLSVERERDALALSERSRRHARTYFQEKLVDALGADRVTDQPGPGVLRLSVLITEYVPNNPAAPERVDGLGGIIHRAIGVGGAAFQAVLTDARTGEVVAVLADREEGPPFGSNVNLMTEFGDADRAIRSWSRQIAGFLSPAAGQG